MGIDENLNLIYTISMDLLDMHIDKEHSKIEKANLSMAIGNLNLNLKAYEELLKFLQENRENLENLEKMEELQILILELFAKSKNMYIEISDLSLSSLTKTQATSLHFPLPFLFISHGLSRICLCCLICRNTTCCYRQHNSKT